MWSVGEEKELCRLVNESGTGNWKEQADMLGSGRSADAVKQKWLKFLRKSKAKDPERKQQDLVSEDEPRRDAKRSDDG